MSNEEMKLKNRVGFFFLLLVCALIATGPIQWGNIPLPTLLKAFYKIGVPILFLLISLILYRSDRYHKYWKVYFAFFVGAMSFLVVWSVSFFYSIPTVRLVSSGYGELTTSIIVANLVPALAFLLQRGELHRLVAMSTFPLTLLHLAMMLAFELPDYGNDVKFEKLTLMVRLGWERGMNFHNLLILSAYLLIGLAMLLGFPTSVGLPALLSLPLGVFQIWYMNRIAAGAKPHWSTLGLMAILVFGVTVYLMTFVFWTR